MMGCRRVLIPSYKLGLSTPTAPSVIDYQMLAVGGPATLRYSGESTTAC